MMLFLVYAAAVSIAKWSKGSFNYKIFKAILIVLISFGFLDIINKYPEIIAVFSTAKPYMNQLITGVGGYVIFVSIGAFFLSSIIGNITRVPSKSIYKFSNFEVLLLSVGILGFMKFATNVEQIGPYWTIDQGFTNTYFPMISHINTSIYTFFNNSIILMFIFSFLNNLTDYGRKRQWLYVIILFLFVFFMNGMVIGNSLGIDSFNHWIYVSILMSLIFIALYKFFLVYDLTIIPIIVSIILSSKYLIISTTNAYPSILMGNMIPAILVICLGYYFRKYLINSTL